MIKEFQKFKELEKCKEITIGLHRNHANNFWYRQTTAGKVLNLFTWVLSVFSIFVIVKYGFFDYGAMAILATVFYAVLIQKVASNEVRKILLNNEDLFNVAYESRSITIKNNTTGNVVYWPGDWRQCI